MTAYIISILLLAFGFGFVIFFHELGHFLAAKWVGIRVEQFAVGFGQALVSWRKGMGVTMGSSGRRYEELEKAGAAAGIGETEYRLNWIPLGGYVKMLGQDDLRPNAQQDDPRAYNKKSIGARMVVVSAGVIMNIILAAIGFMVLFMMGFNAPPAVVGNVQAGSPAAQAVNLDTGKPSPLRVGDRILYFDDKYQHDFTKITLNVALVEPGVAVPMFVRRVDGTGERLSIAPQREAEDPHAFLMLGVGQPSELRGMKESTLKEIQGLLIGPEELEVPGRYAVKPGDTIVAVNGEPVVAGGAKDEYWKLDRAVQQSQGKPVELTVKNASGDTRTVSFTPVFDQPFGDTPLSFAGMEPRITVPSLRADSPAKGKLQPGDVVAAIAFRNGGDTVANPTAQQFVTIVDKAGRENKPLDFTVERGGQLVTVENIVPSVKLKGGRYGLNIGFPQQDATGLPVVGNVREKSPAAAAGVPAGATITAINGQPVASWHDVRRLIAEASPEKPLTVATKTESGDKQFELRLKPDQIAQVQGLRYAHPLLLHERVEPRKAANPWQALQWGVVETRDFVLQFYLTLQRMFQGSVSYKNMMGPVGIFGAGTKFAAKGPDWLIWFLAMISANLAVVNFLPIPIVDGGLFTFLIIEKIQGRPLSAKTQSIAQVVGLALILSVFLLVTYQDIVRFL